MQIVTEEFLLKGLKSFNHINKSQLILLNEDPNTKKGWKDRVLRKEISSARAELFILLKGISGKNNQEKIIDNFKKLQLSRKTTNLLEKDTKFTLEKVKNLDIKIYCDGGCSPNPGESGSGVAIYHNNKLYKLWYGLYKKHGTNNSAEINALYQSLLIAKQEQSKGNRVEILSDSMYCINCISVWAHTWKKNGWVKRGGEIKNLNLIKQAYEIYDFLKNKIKLSFIKAHIGVEGNELADRMTIYAIEKKETSFKLYDISINISKILKMRIK